MTGAPDPEPARAGRWRQATTRVRDRGRRTGLRAGTWLAQRWQQTVALLRGMEPSTAYAPPPSAAPVRVTQRRDAEIVVPAQGYIYGFVIRASFSWSAEGLRPELLSWYAQQFQPLAVQQLTRLAADLARSTAPHHAGELEVRLHRAIGEADWTFPRAEGTVSGRPDAWVRLDERVQQALLPYSKRRVTLESEYELHLARARSAQQLAHRWSTILREYADTAAEVDPQTQEGLVDAARRMLGLQKIATQWIEDLLAERPRTGNWFDRPPPAATRAQPDRSPDVPRQPGPPPADSGAAADGDSSGQT
ncbi:hypothetical protein E1211_16410 [Micromonospora sp. 15K316]|uniref:hypothetical protein n=1 Tax=Micromonospora sp. 15K316 TaxID=2530376 RepID=UPI00104A1F4E|nr:hypothetical protein [Micromonospora sp. 15K316]TDC35084.1 hypothetical protein E1211_16410 [Micromonospora sp. 15K316]